MILVAHRSLNGVNPTMAQVEPFEGRWREQSTWRLFSTVDMSAAEFFLWHDDCKFDIDDATRLGMNHARIQVLRSLSRDAACTTAGAPHTIVILLSVVSAANLIEDPFPGLCFRRPTPGTTQTGIQNCSTPTNPGAGPSHIPTAASRRETPRGFGGEYIQVSSYYRHFPSRLLARIYRVSPSSYQKARRRSHSPLDNVWVYLTTRPSPGLRTRRKTPKSSYTAAIQTPSLHLHLPALSSFDPASLTVSYDQPMVSAPPHGLSRRLPPIRRVQ